MLRAGTPAAGGFRCRAGLSASGTPQTGAQHPAGYGVGVGLQLTVHGCPAKPLLARCSHRFGSTTPGRPTRLSWGVESVARRSVLGSKGRTLGTVTAGGEPLSAVAVERKSPILNTPPATASGIAERRFIRAD